MAHEKQEWHDNGEEHERVEDGERGDRRHQMKLAHTS
jgi:hypothetical protein